jgi:TRAP-type C4-dicarboxylate transport system substrate-binding protein
MPFAELYSALEMKTVDGEENPYSVILSSKFYEVQKYVSATNHVYATNPVQISKRFWDKLSPTERKILQDAAIEAQNYQRVRINTILVLEPTGGGEAFMRRLASSNGGSYTRIK